MLSWFLWIGGALLGAAAAAFCVSSASATPVVAPNPVLIEQVHTTDVREATPAAIVEQAVASNVVVPENDVEVSEDALIIPHQEDETPDGILHVEKAQWVAFMGGEVPTHRLYPVVTFARSYNPTVSDLLFYNGVEFREGMVTPLGKTLDQLDADCRNLDRRIKKASVGHDKVAVAKDGTVVVFSTVGGALVVSITVPSEASKDPDQSFPIRFIVNARWSMMDRNMFDMYAEYLDKHVVVAMRNLLTDAQTQEKVLRMFDEVRDRFRASARYHNSATSKVTA